ncbi:MAG: histidinol dehydrogenase [Desulfovibrionaceae bacterium]
MEYLKKAAKSAEEDSSKARGIVQNILADIDARGEQAVRDIAKKFDKWEGDFLLSESKKQRLIASVPESVKQDIRFAYEQVRDFALLQRASIRDFEALSPAGVLYGQKIVPMDVAGCYVPGGRFAHICSALMSVGTAKAAGVPCVIAASPPRGDSIDPAVCYALDIAGADMVLEMGGVQAIAALGYGLFTHKPANIIVGPGNAYVSEAKALLCGRGICGIDLFAGPSEIGIIADAKADPMTVAIDLLSQAEHGFNSPAWLFTDSRELGMKVLECLPKLIAAMPDPSVPGTSWADYGEVVLCQSAEELITVSDTYAPEHLELLVENPNWWRERLHSYGSLFMSEFSTVTHGDKASGPNHILPTKKSAHYSGGLNVHKFLKILTYQHATKEGCQRISEVSSRLSRAEGMEGHARACDWRLTKHNPDQQWNFHVYKHPQ